MTDKKPRGLPGLRAARIAAGLTQNALARALETHDRQIQNWEGGKTDPSVWAAKSVALALGVTVDQLLEAP